MIWLVLIYVIYRLINSIYSEHIQQYLRDVTEFTHRQAAYEREVHNFIGRNRITSFDDYMKSLERYIDGKAK